MGFLEHANCNDGEPYISLVGLYRPNPFGLYDMVGNITQLIQTCYYNGHHPRTPEEMDNSECEMIGHRGESWHYPPQPHFDRGRFRRINESPSSMMGFRLAADGQSQNENINLKQSTVRFEAALQTAQKQHLASRPAIPDAPQQLQLVKRQVQQQAQQQRNTFELSWQPASDPKVTGYEIYKSALPYSHLIGQIYREHYDKLKTVSAENHSIKVTLPEEGGSFRVVALTQDLSSLPSKPAVFSEPRTLQIPGKLFIQHATALENTSLAYSRKPNNSEPYFISKVNHMYEQLLVTASFKVTVEKSGWYTLNYRGRSFQKGSFFKLWQNNKLVADIDYDSDTDDRTSNRHKVLLDEGEHTLQVTVQREGFDRWSFTWLEFIESKS